AEVGITGADQHSITSRVHLCVGTTTPGEFASAPDPGYGVGSTHHASDAVAKHGVPGGALARAATQTRVDIHAVPCTGNHEALGRVAYVGHRAIACLGLVLPAH